MILRFLFADSRKPYKKPGTWLIKKIDGGPAGHVALSLNFGGDEWVFESVLPESRVTRLEEWKKEYKTLLVYEFVVPESLEWSVLQWTESMLYKPYSVFQIILIGITRLFLPLQVLLKGAILNHERALVCTEFLSRFAVKFMSYDQKKTHDQFGVKDAHEMAERLADKAVWKDL